MRSCAQAGLDMVARLPCMPLGEVDGGEKMIEHRLVGQCRSPCSQSRQTSFGLPPLKAGGLSNDAFSLVMLHGVPLSGASGAQNINVMFDVTSIQSGVNCRRAASVDSVRDRSAAVPDRRSWTGHEQATPRAAPVRRDRSACSSTVVEVGPVEEIGQRQDRHEHQEAVAVGPELAAVRAAGQHPVQHAELGAGERCRG